MERLPPLNGRLTSIRPGALVHDPLVRHGNRRTLVSGSDRTSGKDQSGDERRPRQNSPNDVSRFHCAAPVLEFPLAAGLAIAGTGVSMYTSICWPTYTGALSSTMR